MTRNAKYDFVLPSSPWMWVMNFGLLLIVAGTALPLLNLADNTFRYIYSAGAAIALTGRIAAPSYKGTIIRIVRLSRIEIWSCIAFCVGAFFMWYSPESGRDWLAFTLAGGALQVYTSLMIPRTMRREQSLRGKSDNQA